MVKKELMKKIKYSLRFIPDKIYIQLYYFAHMKRFINFKNPKTFNEKLQWLKLYDRNPLYTTLVDKYAVKDYVSKIIGKEYIIPTLGVYDKFDDINFDMLPNQFVIKCTHDSGGLIICKDKNKLDFKQAQKKINECLKHNFFYIGREWPYKNVKPRIIVETYLENEKNPEDLQDYKFMCFNQKVKCIFVCSERNSKEGLSVDFFDLNWEQMSIKRKYKNSDKIINKPKNYNKMIELSEKLSENIPFVRVDFYEVNGKIYFGELTLYPGCGFEKFSPFEWDYKFGEWLNIKNGGKK